MAESITVNIIGREVVIDASGVDTATVLDVEI